MSETFVVVNPSSGGGSTGRNWVGLARALEVRRPRAEIAFTTGPRHATALVRAAVRRGADEIVVVGGDGTLNEAAEGLFVEDEGMGMGRSLLNEQAVLVPVRRGTGGDFARHLGLVGKGPSVFAHLDDRPARPLDLGICEYTDPAGARCRRAFVNVASFGLSGRVDEKVNASSKRLGGLSFALSAASALLAYRRVPVRVRVDGELVHEGPLVLGAVANGPYFGGGMRIAPGADPSSGRLEVVLLLEQRMREIVRAPQVMSGRHVRWPSARIASGRVIEAEALGDACLLDLDGEQPGRLDARFELLPGAGRYRA